MEINITRNLIECQLLQLCPVPLERAGVIQIRIRCAKGQTKWLNISKEQLCKIESILCEGELV